MRILLPLIAGLALGLILVGCSPEVEAAEQIYVKKNASLPEVVPDPPFVVTDAMKTKLNNDAPVHPVYGVKYLTKRITRNILKISGREAQQALDAMVEDDTIKTYETRYTELYPPEEP